MLNTYTHVGSTHNAFNTADFDRFVIAALLHPIAVNAAAAVVFLCSCCFVVCKYVLFLISMEWRISVHCFTNSLVLVYLTICIYSFFVDWRMAT